MFTIGNVKPETVVALIAKLKADPSTLVSQLGNEFTITGHGVTAQAAYDPKTQTLTGIVSHKPWFVPESLIESKLRQQIDEVQG